MSKSKYKITEISSVEYRKNVKKYLENVDEYPIRVIAPSGKVGFAVMGLADLSVPMNLSETDDV